MAAAGRPRIAASRNSAPAHGLAPYPRAQLAGFEEPENRQHPPVLGCALRQVELGQDAADVFLDRALGDEDPAGDTRVGRALGHEGEHVALARRQDIERITAGASVVDPSLVQELVRARRRRDPLDVLSPREREVLALMAEGASNAGIARRIFVTEGTVEKHVRSILTKLDLPESDTDHRRVLAVLRFLGAR